ncbi:hypothetical protein E3C22_16320 [Jiella endophytica]|uniref:REase AHJR-like domain-containing protein n=1 Tax=Jiella endophytica TaxID=2558362 RepID=A0A4Y8RFI6_9HYPH|nr:hypothetical protein [Jiella endophytica]TFF20473.1 hypothetical protein E3C22_16320 [Jiella endophytica]
MTLSTITPEEAALDVLEPQLVRDGFTVLRQPTAEQLPKFLTGYLPDAVAYGAGTNLAIEIKSPRRSRSEPDADAIRKLFEGHPDWQLRFIYYAPSEPLLQTVSDARLKDRIAELRKLATLDPQAALVMAWAALEGTLRAIEPGAGELRGPRSVASFLASQGYVDIEQTRRLLSLADLRSQIAHGEIDREPAVADVTFVLDVADGLRQEAGLRDAG